MNDICVMCLCLLCFHLFLVFPLLGLPRAARHLADGLPRAANERQKSLQYDYCGLLFQR